MIQIINPSAPPNGYIINGVAHFTQSTTIPSVRIDGSPLQNGDFWNKPTDGSIAGSAGLYVWRSAASLWVTYEKRFMSGGRNAGINTITVNANLIENGFFCGYSEVALTVLDSTLDFPQFNNLYCSGWAFRHYSTTIATNFDASNRFDLRVNIANSPISAGDLIVTVNSPSVMPADTNGLITYFPLNSVINKSGDGFALSASVRVKNIVGAPAFASGTLRPLWTYILQGVHP